MLQAHGVPAFDDNYLWVIDDGRDAVAVDPGDAAPVEAHLAARGLRLVAILATHRHADHVGDLPELAAHWGCEAYGPAGEAIAGLTRRVREGERIPLLGVEWRVIDVPGHTAGHVAYAGDGRLFCGDTLFAGGCGRLFEGTPAQMAASLAKLAALPPETLVHCAHEYTLSNLRFARAVEPGNAALAARAERDAEKRSRGEPTVPSTIAEELATNPFLRCAEPEIAAAASRHAGRPLGDPVEVFAAVRAWKDGFR